MLIHAALRRKNDACDCPEVAVSPRRWGDRKLIQATSNLDRLAIDRLTNGDRSITFPRRMMYSLRTAL